MKLVDILLEVMALICFLVSVMLLGPRTLEAIYLLAAAIYYELLSQRKE